MEPWQRINILLIFGLIGCVITLVVMRKKNAYEIATYKLYACIINFILFMCIIIFEDAFTQFMEESGSIYISIGYMFTGPLIVSFMPLYFGHRVYVEMFCSEGGRPLIKYRSFEMIVLLVVVCIMSMIIWAILMELLKG